MRAGLLCAVLVVLARQAAAANPPVRTVGLGQRDGRLVASVGVQDLFQPAHVQRLHSGFATRILVRISLYKVGRREPVAATLRQSEILYDLWGEKFRVRRIDPDQPPAVREVNSAAEAIQEATSLLRFPVADLARLEPGAQYQLSFRADLNPLSEELRNEVRRWLIRPPGQGRLSSGDGFFGSFVSIFVNPNVEESERQLVFFSQPFVAWTERR